MALLRWIGWMALALLGLQLFFVLRIALTIVVAPESTAFQRSEAWRVATERGHLKWRQQWIGYEHMSEHLKQAVVASEDDDFAQHEGVDWEAMEQAWRKNAKAQEQVTRRAAANPAPKSAPAATAATAKPAKLVGGSTITQQLAKNLLLSGERNLLRKAQELVLTMALELLLDKRRILEIYLNSVEWGEGVFGAEAAAQHYFRKSASRLSAYEAARLAVMLPRPKYFEKLPNSGYLASRAQTIQARMAGAKLP